MNRPQQFGKDSESKAVDFLKKNGYKILETNYRNSIGEIDIIAKNKGALVFVEVKARSSFRFGNPKYAIGLKKQRKISMAALCYLKATRQTKVKARFDVVIILSSAKTSQIKIIKNAFELAYS